MKAISMFSSAGISNLYLDKLDIKVIAANELIPRRSELHEFLYPNCKMIKGSIIDSENFNHLKNIILEEKPQLLISTPPCQGMSSLGKKEYDTDERNYLINYTIDLIENFDFDYIIIENVPKFLKMYFPHKEKLYLIDDLLKEKFSERYNIDSRVFNVENYGVPQSRPRAIIRLWKKNKEWILPEEEEKVTLEKAIGDLPSLESGEKSDLKWHYSKIHNEREILAMRNTATGYSAMNNKYYYPRKKDGTAIKGFHNTYKRMRWDTPSPARVINNGSMGGHNNVHPGRLQTNGTYSDARVLTLRELFIVSSLPADWDLPDWASDTLIRTVIGEAIPPLFFYKIVKGIF